PTEFNEYFDHMHIFPHIARWMPPEVRKFGSTVVDKGAGQNRLVGRLAFFNNYRRIRTALERRIRTIVDQAKDTELRRAWLPEGAKIDTNRLDIVLVYSL